MKQFEGSGRWPSELAAIRKLKSALYLKMAAGYIFVSKSHAYIVD